MRSNDLSGVQNAVTGSQHVMSRQNTTWKFLNTLLEYMPQISLPSPP